MKKILTDEEREEILRSSYRLNKVARQLDEFDDPAFPVDIPIWTDHREYLNLLASNIRENTRDIDIVLGARCKDGHWITPSDYECLHCRDSYNMHTKSEEPIHDNVDMHRKDQECGCIKKTIKAVTKVVEANKNSYPSKVNPGLFHHFHKILEQIIAELEQE